MRLGRRAAGPRGHPLGQRAAGPGRPRGRLPRGGPGARRDPIGRGGSRKWGEPAPAPTRTSSSSTPACSPACGSERPCSSTAAGTSAGRATPTPRWPPASSPRGERLVCLPAMGAEYVPRDTLRGLWRQYLGYGEFRARTYRAPPALDARSHLLAAGRGGRGRRARCAARPPAPAPPGSARPSTRATLIGGRAVAQPRRAAGAGGPAGHARRPRARVRCIGWAKYGPPLLRGRRRSPCTRRRSTARYGALAAPSASRGDCRAASCHLSGSFAAHAARAGETCRGRDSRLAVCTMPRDSEPSRIAAASIVTASGEPDGASSPRGELPDFRHSAALSARARQLTP